MRFTIALYVFCFALLVMLIIFRYFWVRKKMKERLSAVGVQNSLSDTTQLSPLRGIIREFSVYFESVSWARQKEELLIQAGIPFRGSEFMVVSLGAAAIGFILLLALLGRSLWLGAIVGGGLAFYMPTMIVMMKIKKKRAMLNEQLPAALTAMANSLRSGYSYMQAMDLVSKEMPYPLGEEFGLVVKEMNLGITIEEALNNLVKRVSTNDLDLMVTAFLIQRQVGGNLAELFDNIAATLTERVRMKERIDTLTAQGKLSGWVLCLLPVLIAFALYILNPEYILSFIIDPRGQVALAACIISQVCGIFWMRKIVNIEL